MINSKNISCQLLIDDIYEKWKAFGLLRLDSENFTVYKHSFTPEKLYLYLGQTQIPVEENLIFAVYNKTEFTNITRLAKKSLNGYQKSEASYFLLDKFLNCNLDINKWICYAKRMNEIDYRVEQGHIFTINGH